MKISNNIPQEDAFDKLAKSLDLKPFQPQEDAFDKLAKSQQKEKDFYVLIKNEGSIADRHNNPGNLIYAGQEGAEQGEKRDDGTYWAKFESPKAGFDALVRDIEIKQSEKSKTGITGESTIEEYFAVYAPAYENDTTKIINEVTKSLGVSPKTQIKEVDRYELAKETAKWESSTKVFEPEEPKLSFQEEKKSSVPDFIGLFDRKKDYKVTNELGVQVSFLDKVNDAAQRAERPLSFLADVSDLQKRIESLPKHFPETSQEANILKEQLSQVDSRNIEQIKQQVEEIENQFLYVKPTMANPRGAGDPRWIKYEDEVVKNPATVAIKRLEEDSKRLVEAADIPKGKEVKGILNKFYVMEKARTKGFGRGIEEYGEGYSQLIDELKKNQAVTDVLKKLEQAEEGQDVEFTDDEKLVLKAFISNAELHEQLDDEVPRAYKIGEGAGQSLGYMAEFFLTGGGAKSLGQAALKKAAKVGAKKYVGKFGIGMGIKLAQAGVQSTKMPMMYQKAAINVSQGMDFGSAMFDAFYETTAENFSERIFLSNPVGGKGAGVIDDLVRRMGINLKTDKGAVGILLNTLEETGEEKIGEIITAPKDYENFKDFWKAFTDKEQNLIMIGSVASMTGTLGSGAVIGNAVFETRTRSKLAKFEKFVPSDLRSEIDVILEAKDLSVKEQFDMIGNAISERIDRNELGEDPATTTENAMLYTQYKANQVVFESVVEELKAREKEITETEKTIEQTTKEIDELTKTQKELDIDIKALEKKKERTESEDAKIEKLKTSKAEVSEKILSLGNILKENEKKLADKKSFLSEYEEVEDEEVGEKFPKSETAPEGEFPKKETLQPKNIKDLEEVSRRIFGEKDEKKVKASAVVMDILIGNMAKRAGMSKAEMYKNFDFTKISPEELLGEEGVQQQKGLTYKGASVVRNGRNIIYAMTSPDVSTPMHEMAHAFEPFLATEERDAILAFAGEKEWADKVSETFAKGFERYLAEGKAPNSKLQEIFENFKNWLLDIYRGITKSEIDIELNKPMRDIYDRMLAEDVELKEKEDGRVTDERRKPEQEEVRGEALLGKPEQEPKQGREAEKPKGEAVQKAGKEREAEVESKKKGVQDAEEVTPKVAETVPKEGTERRSVGQRSVRDYEQDRETEKAETEKEKIKGLSPESQVLFQSVWHGSPAEFEKFSTKYIGTGEGAQAFGWGLYFTDRKGIAEAYAKMRKNVEYDLRELISKEEVDKLLKKYPENVYLKDILSREYSTNIERTIDFFNGLLKSYNRLKELSKFKINRPNIEKNELKDIKDSLISRVGEDYAKIPINEAIKNLKIAVNILEKYKPKISRNLYKVKLHGDRSIDEFNYLRWDKPLTDSQKKKIINQLKKEDNGRLNKYLKEDFFTGKAWTREYNDGGAIYDALSRVLGSQKEASLFLLRAGIDGIKYPTEITRRGTHEDSFNYVIFDENIAEIEDHIKFQIAEKIPEKIEVDGKQRHTRNSKGQVIHSTEEGIRNFWKWFGDSKVVDDEGKPLVVYHGTDMDFDEFKNPYVDYTKYEEYIEGDELLNYTDGIYFTAYPTSTEQYTPIKGGSVMPVYLKILNPKVIEDDIVGVWDVDKAKKKGFDGAIGKGWKNIDFFEVVVNSPTQIKSATGNLGTFSKETVNILFQTVSEPETPKKITFPGEVLVSAKKAYDESYRKAKSKSKQSRANAAVSAWAKVRETEWFKGLSKEEQLAAGTKFSEITENLTTRPTRMEYPEGKTYLTVSKELLKNIGIKAEKKAEIDAERDTNRKFGLLKDAILTSIKEAVDKKNITGGQYRSIIRRLGDATTDRARQRVLDYVEDVLEGSEYKGQYNKAKDFQRKFEQAKDKFGAINKAIVEGIEKINLKDLTIEELYEFNKGAERALRSRRVPNIQAVSDYIAQFFSRVKEEKISTDIFDDVFLKNDFGKLHKYVNDIFNDLEKFQEGIKKDEVSAKDFANLQRRMAVAQRLRDELNKANKLTNDAIEKLDELFGKIEEAQRKPSGKLKDSFDALIDEYIEQIAEYKKENKKQINKVIQEQPVQIRELILQILDAKGVDLKEMSIADIEAYREIISNLKEGYLSPYMGAIEQTIVGIRGSRNHYAPFFRLASSAKQWQKFRKQLFVPFNKAIAQKIQYINKYRKLKDDGKVRKRNMNITLMTVKPHRWGTLIGVYDEYAQAAIAHTIISRAINKAHALEEKFDKKLQEACRGLSKAFKSQEELEQVKQRLGFFMIERTWQSSDEYISGKIPRAKVSLNEYIYELEKEANKKRMEGDPVFDIKASSWLAFKEYLKENNAIKEVETDKGDLVETIDIDKAEALLRENKEVSKFIDNIDNIYKEFESFAKTASLRNGYAAGTLENFFPLYTMAGKPPVPIEKLENDVYSAMNIALYASSTHDRHRALQIVNNDIKAVTQNYLREMSRNYYVTPALKGAIDGLRRGIKQTFNEVVESDESNAFDLLLLERGIEKDIITGLNSYYNHGAQMRQKNWADKAWRKLIGASKIGHLAKPQRVPAELASNSWRALWSLGGLSIEEIKNVDKNLDLFNVLLEEYVGQRYISRWGEEIRENVFGETKIGLATEKGATWMITFADTQIGRRLFAIQFSRAFDKLSKKPFDADKYANDEKYRIENKEIFDKAAFVAVRKVEELFNDKTPMTQRQFHSFFGGILRGEADALWVYHMNFLQNFNRNEADQMTTSWRRLWYGAKDQKVQALRDFMAISVSNFMYIALRTSLPVLVRAIWLKYRDDEPDEYTAKLLEEMKTWEKWRDDFLSSNIGLMWGGSANIMKIFPVSVGMYAIDGLDFIDEDTKEVIFQSLEREFYMRRMPRFGSSRQIIESTGVVPGRLVPDAFSFISDFQATANIIADVLGADDKFKEEDIAKAMSAVNLAFMYSLKNPLSPWFDERIKQWKRNIAEEKKYEGVPKRAIPRMKEQERLDKEEKEKQKKEDNDFEEELERLRKRYKKRK